MNKKSIALVVIGIAIGGIGMLSSWWIIAALPNEDPIYCGALSDTILPNYDKIFDEDGKPDERSILTVIKFSNAWHANNCDKVIPDMAPTIKEIRDHVLELEISP